MTASDRERIQGLLAEGWRRLESGEPREAALVFGRVALVEPTRAEAVRGLAAANAAITESQRQADERLEQARQALERGDHAVAVEFLVLIPPLPEELGRRLAQMDAEDTVDLGHHR